MNEGKSIPIFVMKEISSLITLSKVYISENKFFKQDQAPHSILKECLDLQWKLSQIRSWIWA